MASNIDWIGWSGFKAKEEYTWFWVGNISEPGYTPIWGCVCCDVDLGEAYLRDNMQHDHAATPEHKQNYILWGLGK